MTKLSSFSTLLQEGITHLEDLDLQAFIRAVQNIAKMQASEKLDGANLWFGLDDEGRLYTSRAGKRKNAENMYEEKDYPYFAAYNGFRAAHAALKAKEEDIKKVLRPGDTVEIEVLFGRQPNAVLYGAGGKNYIAFLRGVDGTQDILVDQLATSMNGQTVQVRIDAVDTIDGVTLKLVPTDITYQFVGVQKLDTAHLKNADVSAQLEALNKYLQSTVTIGGKSMPVFDLATASLGSFDKESRPLAKAEKTKALATILTDFKLPIKKELLDKFVSKVKSPLAATDVTPDEDIGIEGVVLKDPDSGEQIKLVDKDTFTTVNSFNHAVRGTLSGVVKTTDPESSIEARGGLLGALKIVIADLLGNKELARTQGAKKIFASLKGATAEETVQNVAKQLTGGDDFRGTKNKIIALVDNTRANLSQALADFKEHKDEFQLKLKNGKTMGYTAEVIRRTLVSFAETKRDLDELVEKVGKTKNMAQLVALLYGRIAKAVHETADEPTDVTEAKAPVKKNPIIQIFVEFSGTSAQRGRIEKKVVALLTKYGTPKIASIDDDEIEFHVSGVNPLRIDAVVDKIWDGLMDTGADGDSIGILGEGLLLEKKGGAKKKPHKPKRETKVPEVERSAYGGRDAWTLCNMYFATYMMAAVIFKAADAQGIRLLRDKTHMRLTGFDKEMSAFNYWGYPIWRSGSPSVKKLVGPKAAEEIFKHARQCPASYWKFMHMDLSYGKEVPIEWDEHRKALAFIQRVPGMNVDRVNSLLEHTLKYETLSHDEKVKYHARLYYYTQQFVPNSPIGFRVRVIHEALLMNPDGQNENMVEMKLMQQITNGITEDGESPAVAQATSSSSIGSYAQPLFGEKRMITRLKRNPDIVRYKFPRPKPVKKTAGEE